VGKAAAEGGSVPTILRHTRRRDGGHGAIDLARGDRKVAPLPTLRSVTRSRSRPWPRNRAPIKVRPQSKRWRCIPV